MVNFYPRFMSKPVHHQYLLNGFLFGPKTKESQKVVWSPEACRAFGFTKQQLVDAIFLAFSQQDETLATFVNDSDVAVSAVLHQKVN